MPHPEFFALAPTLTLRDPLAALLGAAEEGVIEYRYLDVVKLAGHSCPTVAGAFLMTRRALAHLYGEQLPVRGEIRVELRDDAEEGVTGVIANVMGMLTGATQRTGFKGIAGRFDRRDLLFFNAPIAAEARFTRLDSGTAVEVSYSAAKVPPEAGMQGLMARTLEGAATADEAQRFGALWQERVRRLLLQHADDPQVVTLHPCGS